MEKDKQQTIPNVLKWLAHLMGTEVKNRRLEIPEEFGKGYCTGFVFNEHIRMLISHYELNENLIVKNPDIHASRRIIFLSFKTFFLKQRQYQRKSICLPF